MEDNYQDLMPLSEAAKLSGYTPEHLNLLSRKGTLKSRRIGRNWYITKEELDEFLVTAKKSSSSTPRKLLESLPRYLPGTQERQLSVQKPDGDMPSDGHGAENAGSVDGSSEQDIPGSGRSFFLGRKWAAVLSMVIIIPLASLISGVTGFVIEKSRQADMQEAADALPENKIINERGEVKGEGDANSVETAYASENFRISQMSLGGQGIALGEESNDPLAISDIKSESYVSGSKGSVKLLVSWKTNKPAISSLVISRSNGQEPRTVSEDTFGNTHSAVVAGLEPRASYVFSIGSTDHWGNKIDSNFFGFYSASKPESVFNLIGQSMGDVFGWAMKR